jgi:sugar phosphate isomerase/epimerase
MAKKFGMKILVHNHTQEFAFLEGSTTLRPYDILLSQTDPSLVAMQLDIGWASVAGQDIIGMFRKNPGRYELWHVKDAKGLKEGAPQDLRSAKLVPVGTGEVDYKTIFKYAELAGMKHYCVEQDNAAESGDAIASARTSYQNLVRILS